MTMLPWFNQYPYTDFHELNIDWLCTAYKQYHEQLVQFDQRLDDLETDVNERISAMEADIAAQDVRINTFITTINAEFASFRSEINQQFADLETSFNERFTTLQTNLEAEISALEASINQQFADLSSDINNRITAFENEVNQALADLEKDLEATTEFAYDTMASDKLMGTYNYFPVKDVAPWSGDNITFQSTAGVILCNGHVDEDQHITIAGGSNSFPAAFKDMPEDMDFLVQLQSFAQQASGFPKLIMIFYVNGVEDRRETFDHNGLFTITELYHRTLSGIELQWHLETGVTYNVKIRPFIYGVASGGKFAYNMYTLRGFISDWSDRVYKAEIDSDYANSRNIIPQFTDDNIEKDDIRISGQGILYIVGTAASDMVINLSDFIAPVVDTYGTIFIDPEGEHTVYDSIAIDLAVYDSDLDDYVTVATLTPDKYTVIPAASEPYTDYTMRLRLTAGSYDVNCIPYVSYNKSNKQLEDEASELEDRVQDIEDELMGETTYGPADIVTFTDPVGDVPLKEVVVDIIPNQNLNGYDYPWPAGGNKNLIEVTNGSHAAGADLFNGSVDLPAGTYTLSSSNTTSQIAVAGIGSGVMPYTFTLSAAVTSLQIIAVQAGTFNDVQLETGSSPTSYAPYENICPITGWSSAVVSRVGNLIDYSSCVAGYLSYAGVFTNPTSAKEFLSDYIEVTPSSDLNFTAYIDSTSEKWTAFAWYKEDKTFISRTGYDDTNKRYSRTVTVPNNAYYVRIMWRNYSDTISSVVAYNNGNGNTYTIAFGDTYYGGKLNVTTGVLTVNKAIVDMGSLNYTKFDSTEGTLFRTQISGAKLEYNVNNLLCSAYHFALKEQRANGIYSIPDNLGNIDFINNSYSDAAAFKTAMAGQTVCYELATPLTIQLTPLEIKTNLTAGVNNISTNVGQITVTTHSFVQNLIEKYTERYIITYNSVAGTADRTYNEILEAYTEGRRLCFTDTANSLITELNQYDDTNGVFHWEYNEFTTTGITFYEILIDISGVTVNSKSVTI